MAGPEVDVPIEQTNGQGMTLDQAWANIVNACSLAPLNLGQQQLLQSNLQLVAETLRAAQQPNRPARRAKPA